MQIEVHEEVSLFVRDRITGRLVFNSKAIEALGLIRRTGAARLPCGWRGRHPQQSAGRLIPAILLKKQGRLRAAFCFWR